MHTERLNIGLDVDGVLADYMSGIAAVGRAHGHAMSGGSPSSYWLVEPGWFPDDQSAHAAMDALRHSGLGDLRLFDATAPAAVADLRTAGHRVTVVTARHPAPDSRATLTRWLNRHGIGFDDLHFEAVKSRLGCSAYLDDAPHNIAEVRSAGHHGVVRDTTYNRHVDGLRVASLAEFAELVHTGIFAQPAA